MWETITVFDPQGERSELKANIKNHLGEVYFSRTKYPGLYKVHSQGSKSEVNPNIFAINLPVEESDLTPIEHNELEKLLSGWRIDFISEISHFDATLSKSRKGIGLWSWLLILAVLGLLAETIYSNNIIKRG